MEKEIKKILGYFRKYATIRENTMITEIEDYITNLQEEKEDYKSRCEKANWWLKEMLKQARSDETKAVINGTLELLLNGGDENVKDKR